MTKEEILESQNHNPEMLDYGMTLKAMSEYAKQESIGFKKWCDNNQAEQEYGRGKSLTNEELYEIYSQPTIFIEQSKK